VGGITSAAAAASASGSSAIAAPTGATGSFFFSASACTHREEAPSRKVKTTASASLQTFDTGLRLPAREAGFAAALEAGFPPTSEEAAALDAGLVVVSVAVALEAGFAAALEGGLVAGLEAGLDAA
jgi:hypothetical protein